MTGAGGFVGSVITEFAITEGYEVHGLSRSEKGDAKLKSLGAVPVRGDLKSLDVLRSESAKADIVMHLADALADDFNMDYTEVIRIDGAVVDAIGDSLKGTDKPLITTSGTLVVAADPNRAETTESSPVDQKPLNDRIRSEQYAQSLCSKGVKVITIRLAPYVYGRGGSGIRLFMSMAQTMFKAAIYVDSGTVHTSTVHVDDAARLYLLAAKNAKTGEVYNATSSTNVTQRQLSEAMGSALQLPARSVTVDEVAAKAPPFLARFLSAENRASSAKAVKNLGWQPREPSILEELSTGSYVAVAEELHKNAA